MLGVLALSPTAAACQPSVQAHFADRNYTFPLHIDRSPRVPELGSAGFRAQTCREAPEKAALLARATAAIRSAEVARLARRNCPTAQGVLLTDPFFADRGQAQAELAVRFECYGIGSPAPGVSLEQATARASRFREQRVEQALDGWAVHLWRRGCPCWIKWNIALFAIDGERVSFRGFVKRYDAAEYRDMIIPEYVDELHELAACGRRRQSGKRIRNSIQK